MGRHKSLTAPEPEFKTKEERSIWKLREMIPDTGSYDKDTKIEALTHYLVNGSLKAAARELDIPRATLRGWSESTWWSEGLSILRYFAAVRVDSRFTAVIHKTLSALEDKLEKGEIDRYDEESKTYSLRPLRVKELVNLLFVLSEKRHKILGDAESTEIAVASAAAATAAVSATQGLANLANNLANLSDKPTLNAERVEDAEEET